MMREMADPTPALDLVAEQVIRPRLEYVASIVAEILGSAADDEVVRRCVLSVQAQIHAVDAQLHGETAAAEPAAIRRSSTTLAEHIARFSLAGIHASAQQASSRARGRRSRRSTDVTQCSDERPWLVGAAT